MILTGLLVALCLSGAVAQTTQSPIQCYTEALAIFLQDTNDLDCINMLAQAFDMTNPSQVIPSRVTDFCTSSCAPVLNNYIVGRCQLEIIFGLCAMDSNGLCLGQNLTAIIQIPTSNVLTGPCLNTDCSNSTCNSAIQNLTCCVDANLKLAQVVGAPSPLPSDCTPPVCENMLGGAPMLIALPLTVIMALLLSLFAIM